MGISLSVRPVDEQRRQLAVRFYSKLVLCKVRGRFISWENRVGHEQILYQADQNFQTKKRSYFTISKGSDETFCCSKDTFRGHLIYGGG